MAILALDPSDPAADGSRWALMRTSLPAAWLHVYWLTWTVAAEVSGCASLTVILLVLLRPTLRRQAFNKFILGLVVPDFVFSFSCGWTCLVNYMAGHWHGGEAECTVQGVYLMYGVSASVWMNLLVAHELDRLSLSLVGGYVYRTPPASAVWARIGCVHLAAMAFAVIPMVPRLPAEIGLQRGLFCFVMEYDRDSTIFQWVFTFVVLDLVPTCVLLVYFKRIYCRLFHGTAEVRAADRAIFAFFLRLFAVFFIMWHPVAIIVWIVTWNSPVPQHAVFYAGLIAHFQGLVSALLHLRKSDIWVEVALLSAAVRARLLRRDPAAGQLECVGSTASLGASPSMSMRRSSTGDVTATLLLQELSADVMARICEQEQAPMRVVELEAWLALQRFPRSSDGVTRPLCSGDVVIFVSHRWWGPECPDDSVGTKYARLSRGAQRLAARHGLEPRRVVLWCDWACIEQDDPDLQRRGVASLITYAARSSFVLIPVSSDPACARAFQAATHPMMLSDYGERAWCRLEVYIFMCVSEIRQKPPYCYGYGPAGVGTSWWPWPARDCLRPLLQSFAKGAAFDYSKLPSAGDLTNEADRSLIRDMEEQMRDIYTRTAILAQKLRLQSMWRLQVCDLQEKQLRCLDVSVLANEIFVGDLAGRITELRLDGNLLAADGVAELLERIVCERATSSLAVLSLSNNPHLGGGGIDHIARWLPHRHFTLTVLRLSRCALTDEAVQPLFDSLPSCRRLQHLDLSHNELGDASCDALLEACGGCDRPAVGLDLDGNPLSSPSLLKLTRARIALELGQRSIAGPGQGPIKRASVGGIKSGGSDSTPTATTVEPDFMCPEDFMCSEESLSDELFRAVNV